MNETMIQLDDVCFSYEKEPILEHLSMSIEAKSLCFIMGINGSGKTTLLKNMMGFLSPRSGRITINGADVTNTDQHTMSRLVSYVPQAIHLNTDFSVIDYLSLGRTPHLGMIARMTAEDYAIIDRFSKLLCIDHFMEMPFNKLSGGQKQMVAVTRSLIQDTPLIILDEPMSALDIGRQVDLLRALRQFVIGGKTIILTTHNPNHALAVDSISCFLKQGKIISFGKSSDVIQEQLLQEVYGENITITEGTRTKSVVFNMGDAAC